MTTPKATPRLTGEQLRSIMWREEGKAQPRYSPEWYDDLAAAVLAALGSEGAAQRCNYNPHNVECENPAPHKLIDADTGKEFYSCSEHLKDYLDYNQRANRQAFVIQFTQGPVTPPAPGEELGTCDLVSRPHPRNCCGEAWRALAAPPVTAPAKE